MMASMNITKFRDLRFRSSLENNTRGYHLTCKTPIIEKNWENVLMSSLKALNEPIVYVANTHESGRDCTVGNIPLSLKTCKMTKKTIELSSYRLTGCGGDITRIDEEIKRRDTSFRYMFVCSRSVRNNIIHYYMYVIPRTFFDREFRWSTFYKKNGTMAGWCTDTIDGMSFRVIRCMSDQLWMSIDIDAISGFLVHDFTINPQKTPLISYEYIHNMFTHFNK